MAVEPGPSVGVGRRRPSERAVIVYWAAGAVPTATGRRKVRSTDIMASISSMVHPLRPSARDISEYLPPHANRARGNLHDPKRAKYTSVIRVKTSRDRGMFGRRAPWVHIIGEEVRRRGSAQRPPPSSPARPSVCSEKNCINFFCAGTGVARGRFFSHEWSPINPPNIRNYERLVVTKHRSQSIHIPESKVKALFLERWKSKSWKEADERDDHEFLEIEKEIYLDLFPHMVEEMKSEEEATEETKEGEKADPIDIDDDSSTEEDVVRAVETNQMNLTMMMM